jgi:hypothetical protein
VLDITWAMNLGISNTREECARSIFYKPADISSRAPERSYWPPSASGRMLSRMVAKSKPRARDAAPQQSGTLVRASDVRQHLLEEARTLQSAGKIREARAVEKRAAQVDQLVGALEADYRSPDSSPTAH